MNPIFYKHDVYCPTCNYNLRGLPIGNACPECGRKPAVPSSIVDEALKARKLDAEIEEHLNKQAEAEARQARIDELIHAWEERGKRFDRLLDRLEKLSPKD